MRNLTAAAALAALPALVLAAPGERGELVNTIGIRLVLIPPGTFRMGKGVGPGRYSPAHGVTIAHAFYLSATEVTEAQWEAVMGPNPRHKKGGQWPVTHESHTACLEFCRRLTLLERAAGRLTKEAEYRLPTEAEWEYACRAGSTAEYCFGNDAAKLGEHAWYKANSAGQPHAVAQRKPNAWGLYDMHGNVGEWCQGPYREYATRADGRAPRKSDDEMRPIRGGGFGDDAAVCTSFDRCAFPTQGRHPSLGFRVVRTVLRAATPSGPPRSASGRAQPQR